MRAASKQKRVLEKHMRESLTNGYFLVFVCDAIGEKRKYSIREKNLLS